MFANNLYTPYQVIDVTTAGEAVSMISKHVAGGKRLATCQQTWATSQIYPKEGMTNCLVVDGGNVFHMYIVNNAPAGTGSDPTIGVVGTDLNMTFNLAGLQVASGSYSVFTQLSQPGTNSRGANYYGEIAQIVATTAPSTANYYLPAFGILRIMITKNNQTTYSIPLHFDTYVAAGTNANSNANGNLNTMLVHTSNTTDHSTTSVIVLCFDISSYMPVASSANQVISQMALTLHVT